MAQPTQVRTIIVKADTKGNQELRQMAKDLGLLNQNVSSISKSMNIFNKIAGFTFLGMGIQQITNMSDSIQTLKDRLKILTGGANQANDVFDSLSQAAFRTKTSVADLGVVYARMGAATRDLGVNTAALTKFTETLQNTFRLSGSTTTEATAAAIQMSQGFASGQLRGQELRSVLEANVYIGQILADTFGVTRGELYKLAEAGKLTADKVFKAILNNSTKINEEAGKLSQTFDQSLTVAMDKVRVAVFELNKKLGISEGLAKSIDWIINNGEKLVIVLG
jgi:tape measure domain-containing protein